MYRIYLQETQIASARKRLHEILTRRAWLAIGVVLVSVPRQGSVPLIHSRYQSYDEDLHWHSLVFLQSASQEVSFRACVYVFNNILSKRALSVSILYYYKTKITVYKNINMYRSIKIMGLIPTIFAWHWWQYLNNIKILRYLQ